MLIRTRRLCGFGHKWIYKGIHYLGLTFPEHSKAIIYADSVKICFTIKDKMEKFTFKNRILHFPSHPQMLTLTKDIASKKKNNQRRKNKAKQPREESVKMINTL
jgi:hypothetical protein